MFVWDRHSYFLSIELRSICARTCDWRTYTLPMTLFTLHMLYQRHHMYGRWLWLPSSFSCLVSHVRNKTLLINKYVRDDAIDILAITETWLKWGGDSAFITELTPDGYNFVHAPRQCSRGDGVGLLHRETYSCKLLASPCFKHMELLWARLMGTNVHAPINVHVRLSSAANLTFQGQYCLPVPTIAAKASWKHSTDS